MADAVSHSPEPRKPISTEPKNDPSKLYRHFLCKSALVTAFLVLLPLFPSIAPDFINQTVHARIWELLQLICVGIAVSYGLFSQKNDQPKKDLGGGGPKPENAHSFVSKLLQVSSVFDDEPESPQTVVHQQSKVETLSSQYFRGEPMVMVAKQIQNPIVKKDNGFCEISQNKPLLLPVRSLKQRVPESAEVVSGYKPGPETGPLNDSLSRLNEDSKKPRNVEDDITVLRSPIPWGSRSGKMKTDENDDINSNVFDDSKLLTSLLNPNLATPKKLNQSTSFPSKSRAESREDDNVARKKNFSSFSSSPPPAPPLQPTPQFRHKSILLKSSLNDAVPPKKETELSKSEMKKLSRQTTNNDKTQNYNDVVKFVDYGLEFAEKKGYPCKVLRKGNSPVEKGAMETSDYGESEDDDYFGGSNGSSGDGGGVKDNSGINDDDDDDICNYGDVGPDVDKKADEFIAKFREQIRLQRIESIRRSAIQRGGKALI